MRQGPQEKGMREGPREEGEEGQGFEDGNGIWPLGRVGNSIQSMDHWMRGEGRWRATQSAEAGATQKRGASTLSSISQPCYSLLTRPAHNEHPVYAGHPAGHWGQEPS